MSGATDHAAAAPDIDLPETRAIRAHLMKLLPRDALRPNPRKLVEVAAYLVVLGLCFTGIRLATAWWELALLGFVVAQSQLSIGFLAHDLSHGSILRSKTWRYPLEVLLWSVNMTAATIWYHQHNLVHHQNTNTRDDSFRYFTESERANGVKRWVGLLLFPNRTFRWSPFVFLNYTYFFLWNTIGALLWPPGKSPVFVSNIGTYTWRDRPWVAGELAFVTAMQLGIFWWAGGTLGNYFWASIFPFMLATGETAIYLYSQHSLFPVTKDTSPFDSTTIVLPRLVDWLHSNHSQHTAHHLFETMNSDYYPQVTELLAEHYPERLSRMGAWECWRAIQRNPAFKPDPV